MKFQLPALSLALLSLSAHLTAAALHTLVLGQYSGTISILEFDSTALTLRQLSSTTDGSPSPGWQTFLPASTATGGKRFMFSSSEAYDGRNDKITSFEVLGSGTGLSLRVLGRTSTGSALAGPVSSAATGGLVMVSNYGAGAVQTFTFNPTTGLLNTTPAQTLRYTLSTPGPSRPRQDAPHPHQALLDPTSKFLVVPDLGADLLRLYSVGTTSITELPSVRVTPGGSGPRHGIFGIPSGASGKQMYYLLNELGSTVIAFEVTYSANNSGINFTPVQTLSTYPTGTVPAIQPMPTAAEIAISPDGKFIYTTNRSDKTFPNTQYPTSSQSDSLASFSISPSTGRLTFMELTPAGGLTPRHFAIGGANGGFVAIASQDSNRLGIFRRDISTGRVEGREVVGWQTGRGPACVTWVS